MKIRFPKNLRHCIGPRVRVSHGIPRPPRFSCRCAPGTPWETLKLSLFRTIGNEGYPAMKLLIVDDDPLSLRVLRQILLTQPGFKVEEATCGVEAWVLLANPANGFDAVFLDISMPDFGGV